MWRTVTITQGERLSLKNNSLIVQCQKEIKIPIEDIYSVLVDNRQALVSVSILTALTDAGVHVIFCDEKHVPVSVLFPLNTHYRAFNVLNKQIEIEDEFKDRIWQKVIQAKIMNQAKVLKLCGCSSDIAEHLVRYAGEVVPGD